MVFAAIVLPLLVYRANAIEAKDANLLDKVVLSASLPLKRLMLWTTGLMSDSWAHYVDVVHARRENGALRRRLLAVERQRDEYASLTAENRRLRGLLELKRNNPTSKLLAAQVVGAGSSLLSRTVEIDQGALAGVTAGMPVVSGQGLVGVVGRAGWVSSEVVLVADERFSLRAVVLRSRARGRLRGSGLRPSFSLVLTEALRGGDVEVGDRIHTSGLGGVLPAGVPVGVVTAIHDHRVAKHRFAEVEPYVDFARLEWVSVVIHTPDTEVPLVTPTPLLPATLRIEPGPGPLDLGPLSAPSAPEPLAGSRGFVVPEALKKQGARRRSKDGRGPGPQDRSDSGEPLNADAPSLRTTTPAASPKNRGSPPDSVPPKAKASPPSGGVSAPVGRAQPSSTMGRRLLSAPSKKPSDSKTSTTSAARRTLRRPKRRVLSKAKTSSAANGRSPQKVE